MAHIFEGILGLLVLLGIGYCESIRSEKRRIRNEAFSLTKKIGSREIKCVSFTTISNGKNGRAFALQEENAENDPEKFICEISEGWDDSAYTIAAARKYTEKIISMMPYNLEIIDLPKSRTEYLKPRKECILNNKYTEKINDNRDLINPFLVNDLANKRLSVIRMNDDKCKPLWYEYILKCEMRGKEPRYISICSGPCYEIEYIDRQANQFISYFNECSPKNKIESNIIICDDDVNDFLDTHPYYGSCEYAFYGYDYIEKAYYSDNDEKQEI